MSIIVTSFPITESGGNYSNLFRGFVKENIELQFQDESSCSVVTSAGFMKLETFTDYSISANDEGKTILVVQGGVTYEGTITTVNLAPDSLILSIPFVAAVSGISFFIKETNMRMSYRFCEFTTQDDQTATNLFDNNFTFYPDNIGRLYIDISIIKSLMKPNFDFNDALNTDMAKVFQVQFKTVYDSSSDTWHSAHDSSLTAFVPFISAHAGGRNVLLEILVATQDASKGIRVWRGYDKIYSIMINNSNMTGNVYAVLKEYNRAKVYVTQTVLMTNVSRDDGLYNVLLPTLNATTRYTVLEVNHGALAAVQDISTVYDTLLNTNEFYLTWASENSTIRNWLFTSKIDFANKAKYDVLQDSEFRQIPNRYDEKLLLQTKGLSEIEKNYIYDIYLSNKIILENDSNEFECIVSKPSFSFENRSNSYICTIEILKKQRDLMNV